MQISHDNATRRADVPLRGMVALSVALRIAVALFLGNDLREMPGVADQLSYHTLATRVLDGHGFSFGSGWWPATHANEPTAHWSFLYTLFVAAVYGVTGPMPLAARLVQAAIAGFLQPLLTFWIARRLFGRPTALVAAGLVAGYSYFVYYAAALVTESFFILALLWSVCLGMRLAAPAEQSERSRDLGPWLLLGVALATAALLRQSALLLAPVLLAWIAVERRLRRARIGVSARPGLATGIAATLLVMAAAFLPWTIRNQLAFGEFVLLNTNAGFAFFWGNHPMHGTRFIPILPHETYGALIPEALRPLNEAQLDKALLQRGLQFIRDDPQRYLRLSVDRTKEYLRVWPAPDSTAIADYARVLSFGVCAPLFLAGMLLAVRRPSAPSGSSAHRRTEISLLLAVAGAHSLLHLLTWTLVRYRLPVDALLMPFAALALVGAWERLTRARMVPAAAFAVSRGARAAAPAPRGSAS